VLGLGLGLGLGSGLGLGFQAIGGVGVSRGEGVRVLAPQWPAAGPPTLMEGFRVP
jgi:hypothetical protein